jgi:hypothetical protein
MPKRPLRLVAHITSEMMISLQIDCDLVAESYLKEKAFTQTSKNIAWKSKGSEEEEKRHR